MGTFIFKVNNEKWLLHLNGTIFVLSVLPDLIFQEEIEM